MESRMSEAPLVTLIFRGIMKRLGSRRPNFTGQAFAGARIKQIKATLLVVEANWR